ncbi:hypothetical protein IV203_007746 [Nitzschia inconspicua]|uniref:Uncharacterized protein n=1 Tax=Nitzschia inconspicua TaxID=303405 RepID=A0A9K3KXK0_9STRA|nr:hypothetical protein IV203_007746 [Nitzschia inconspicua]
MTFYLSDESQFIATYGPSSGNSVWSVSRDNSFYSFPTEFGATTTTTKTTRTSPTGSDSYYIPPPRTRMVDNIMSASKNQKQQQEQRTNEKKEEQASQHHRDKSSGGMSFSDAFSFVDSICSGSQSFDEPNRTAAAPATATHTPPSSVMRESSPTLSPMTPYQRPVMLQKQQQQQQPPTQYLQQQYPNQEIQSRSNSVVTPSSSSSSSSYSPNTFCHQPSYTLKLQQKAQQQAQQARNQVLPKVTSAAAPFEKMIAPSSYLYGELLKEPGYRHALQAGILWQSLCSQHVHFPALWYDGEEPARPPLGCSKKGLSQKHSIWKYFGRHRVQGDVKLNRLIGNRGSSGRLLMHIVVTSPGQGAVADVCVGCFHPNARGIRIQVHHDPALEHCRDVWTGYRQRDTRETSRMEELLQHYNKGLVDTTPLGGAGSKHADMLTIDNQNLKAVFGARSPLFTLFVPEDELYDLLQRNVSAKCPASITLMRQYLREEEF